MAGYMDFLEMEATKIKVHFNNFNKDMELTLSCIVTDILQQKSAMRTTTFCNEVPTTAIVPMCPVCHH